MTRVEIIDDWAAEWTGNNALFWNNVDNEPWPVISSPAWFVYDQTEQSKAVLYDWRFIPSWCKEIISRMGCAFNRGMMPDYSLYGAGMCAMRPGDFLHEHLDHDAHPHLELRRTHNAIYFIEGDGDLVIGRGAQEIRVKPVPGRVCVFDCNDAAFHRVESPTKERRTLSLYFYDQNCRISSNMARRPKAKFTEAANG